MLKWRDACFSISLATLFFFSIYSMLRSATRIQTNYYFLKTLLPPAAHIALIVNIVFLGTLLFALRQWTRRSNAPWVWDGGVLVVGCIAAVGLIRTAGWLNTTTAAYMITAVRRWSPFLSATVAVAGALLVAAAVRFRTTVARAGALVILIITPLSLLVIARSVSSAAAAGSSQEGFADLPQKAPLPVQRGRPRIIVALFDEADYRLMFDDRPRELTMPEVDRFRSGSLFATRAYPPSNMTEVSVPAFLSGTQFAEAEPNGPNELLLRLVGSHRVTRWSALPSIFSDAESLGVSVGIVGWCIRTVACFVFGNVTGMNCPRRRERWAIHSPAHC